MPASSATISLRDLAVLFQKLYGTGEAPPAEEAIPQLRLKLLRAPGDGSYV